MIRSNDRKSAFIHICEKFGYPFDLLKDVKRINEQQKTVFIGKIQHSLNGKIKGKTIGVLGLSFKPDTDDIRSSPSIDIIKILLKEMNTSMKIIKKKNNFNNN